METSRKADITRLLLAWSQGDQCALEHLVPLVYQQLRKLARHYMAQERPEHTLEATALVHEAYMRLVDWKDAQFQNRAHFFGVAAALMRRVLVDHARRQNYVKRGGQVEKVGLEEGSAVSGSPDEDLEAVDAALRRLAVFDQRKSRIIELRFFGGLSVEETACVLGVSPRTVKREWSMAQAWLYCELCGEKTD